MGGTSHSPTTINARLIPNRDPSSSNNPQGYDQGPRGSNPHVRLYPHDDVQVSWDHHGGHHGGQPQGFVPPLLAQKGSPNHGVAGGNPVASNPISRARASKGPPVVIRKSPENSNSSSGSGPATGLAADSGFNSEPKDLAMANGASVLSARMMAHHTSNMHEDVRWVQGYNNGNPMWDPVHQRTSAYQMQQTLHHGQGELGSPADNRFSQDDELMQLFDIIRKKTERLKTDYEEIKLQVTSASFVYQN